MQVIYTDGVVTDVQFEDGAIPIPIDLDFKQPDYVVVSSNQYEDKSKYIEATLFSDGSPYIIPSGTTAIFCATKPDGKGLFNSCVIFNNKIIYEINLQTTACQGDFGAEFRLYGSNGSVGNPLTFKMNISKSALQDDTVISSNEFNALTDAILEVDGLVTTVEDAVVLVEGKLGAINTAIEDVNIAINNVNTAIQDVNTVVQDANVATENADIATQEANTATTNANNAANLANTKAELADTAIANINIAITNVDTATNNANIATTNANDKANLASTAATNANDVATQLESETLKIFKPAVSTYADLLTTYPTPDNGWTVTVNGESPVVSYRYNGTQWINLGVISSVDTATNTTLGIVKGGGNINVAIDGTISVPSIGDTSQLQTVSKELVGAINELDTNLGNLETVTSQHINSNINTEIGTHGIRYFNGIMQYNDGVDWIEIETGGSGGSGDMLASIYDPQGKAEDIFQYTDTEISKVNTKLADYSTYASDKDGEVYTVVDFKKPDSTLYLKSILSNKDVNGHFQTCKLEYYDDLGTTIVKTVIWTITYDAEGSIITKVVA